MWVECRCLRDVVLRAKPFGLRLRIGCRLQLAGCWLEQDNGLRADRLSHLVQIIKAYQGSETLGEYEPAHLDHT